MATMWLRLIFLFLLSGALVAQEVDDDLPIMETLIVTVREANVRAEPSREADIVLTVGAGASFILIAPDVIDADLWYEVRLRDGRQGWLSSLVANQVMQWRWFVREFDDVEMVLVPAGCFFMGSDSGESDEQPVHLQCFDEAFWIDRYEVTNDAYGGEGYHAGARRPRESVSWFDAITHCEARGARLPTEREWAYSARSPMSYIYPWGNEFVDDYVVSSWRETARSTANVGSRPDGVSWVGAYDMSGNVWEWTASAYDEYPYLVDDGREDLEDENVMRVVRGGACCSYMIADVRATYRFPIDPMLADPNVGFRCARDIDEALDEIVD